MMTAVEGMYGGLSALADSLQVERIGPMHQAGSDSLLTAQTYFSLIRKHLSPFDDKRFFFFFFQFSMYSDRFVI
jgi:CCR4-NOT transcription complex subunit 7/8